MIRGKRGRKRRQAEKDATRMVRADCRWNIEDQINQSSGHSGRRVLMSDSLSTHLDPKSVVARFEKSAEKGE
jgi:hypothetical protein